MQLTEGQQTFLSHLIELRDRLLRAMVVWLVIFCGLMFWAGDIYDLLARPMMQTLPEGTKMIATGVVTPFFVPVKVTMMVAFVVGLPYILYQAWAFIAPGLYEHEKKLGLPLVIGSTLLFIAGMAFCYFFVFGTVFKFIAEFAPKSITPAPDIEQYLAFVMTMFLAFGVTFEIPIAVILLARFGIVSVEKLREARSYVIVGAFVIAAVVTPPDVLSQLLLAIPMCLLYELGIVMAAWLVKQKPAEEPPVAESVPVSDWKPMDPAAMDKELDAIEAQQKKEG